MSDHSFSARTKRYQFENGLTLLVLENRTSPAVAISGYLLAGGYFDPPGKDLLADITAAMLNKGTRRHNDNAPHDERERARDNDCAAARLSFDSSHGARPQGGISFRENVSLKTTAAPKPIRRRAHLNTPRHVARREFDPASVRTLELRESR